MINISAPANEDWKEILNHLNQATVYQLQQATEAILKDRPSLEITQETARVWAATLVLNERLRRLEP